MGRNEAGEATPPEGEQFAAISAGSEHTCALRQDGTVCWTLSPVTHSAKHRLHRESHRHSSGTYHTCALRADGTPVCWGAKLGDEGEVIGQTGFGQSEPPEGEHFVSISSGGNHTCALRADGTPVCWGAGFEEQDSSVSGPSP